MALIVTISASPSSRSKTALTRAYVDARLSAAGHEIRSLDVRDLPPAALLAADTSHPAIAAALTHLAEADAVVVATPVYKASFSGLLKTLLDLLPQRALDGKTVLPLAIGGSLAHVLMLDYSLRPVLLALGAEDILRGLFVQDAHIGLDGTTALADEAETALAGAVDRLLGALARRAAGESLSVAGPVPVAA